jgi:hypothetical protein
MQERIDARKRHHLSHVQARMARELGRSPMNLGKLDNHKQEPWKMTLRAYIEHIYVKRFGKPSADDVMSVEEQSSRSSSSLLAPADTFWTNISLGR